MRTVGLILSPSMSGANGKLAIVAGRPRSDDGVAIAWARHQGFCATFVAMNLGCTVTGETVRG